VVAGLVSVAVVVIVAIASWTGICILELSTIIARESCLVKY